MERHERPPARIPFTGKEPQACGPGEAIRAMIQPLPDEKIPL
jgi:hypothetical protein